MQRSYYRCHVLHSRLLISSSTCIPLMICTIKDSDQTFNFGCLSLIWYTTKWAYSEANIDVGEMRTYTGRCSHWLVKVYIAAGLVLSSFISNIAIVDTDPEWCPNITFRMPVAHIALFSLTFFVVVCNKENTTKTRLENLSLYFVIRYMIHFFFWGEVGHLRLTQQTWLWWYISVCKDRVNSCLLIQAEVFSCSSSCVLSNQGFRNLFPPQKRKLYLSFWVYNTNQESQRHLGVAISQGEGQIRGTSYR